VLGYSPEYQVTEPAHDHLVYLAGLTGGKLLEESWESLAHDLSTGRVRQPIWYELLLAAVLLLPLDVALRRLAISREQVARAWFALRSRLPGPARPVPLAGRPERVGRLFEAKRRAGESGQPSRGPVVSEIAPASDEMLAPPQVEPVRPEPQAGRDKAEPPGGSLAERLLDSKKKRAHDTRE
jgi:hypothetical protein